MRIGTRRGRWLHLAHQGHHGRGDDVKQTMIIKNASPVGLRLRFAVGQQRQLMQAGRHPDIAALTQGGEVVTDLGQPLVQRFVGAVEVFRQPREVQVGAVIENGRARGDANRTTEVAHQVERSRRMFETRRRRPTPGSTSPQAAPPVVGQSRARLAAASAPWPPSHG